MSVEKKLKYGEGINEVCAGGVVCPPQGALETTITAYRWVKKPISPQCFSPQAIKNPARLHNEGDFTKRCSCWALSLYTSLDGCIRAMQNLERSLPKARKIFGDWVAEGIVKPNHGLCTSPESSGHFDLHEYEGGDDLEASFSVCSSIPVK